MLTTSYPVEERAHADLALADIGGECFHVPLKNTITGEHPDPISKSKVTCRSSGLHGRDQTFAAVSTLPRFTDFVRSKTDNSIGWDGRGVKSFKNKYIDAAL